MAARMAMAPSAPAMSVLISTLELMAGSFWARASRLHLHLRASRLHFHLRASRLHFHVRASRLHFHLRASRHDHHVAALQIDVLIHALAAHDIVVAERYGLFAGGRAAQD